VIRAIQGRGLLYWLRAPRNAEDIRHDEIILAYARLLISVCCLAAGFHTEKAEAVRLYGALSGAFLVYSLLIVLRLRSRSFFRPLLCSAIHLADILWAVSLIILINWPTMAIVLFLFVQAGALFRWGFWEVQISAYSFALFLLIACAVSQISLFEQLNCRRPIEFFPEVLFYIVLVFFIGMLAEAKATRAESYTVSKFIESLRLQPGLDQAMHAASIEGLQLYGATQFLTAVKQEGFGKSTLYRMTRSREVLETIEIDFSRQQQYFFPVPARSFRIAGTHHSRRYRFRCLMLKDGKITHTKNGGIVPDSFLAAYSFRVLLAASNVFDNGQEYRVFIIDPAPAAGGTAGLRYLDSAMRCIAPAMHERYMVSRLKRRAETTIKGHLARELHDGVIQSLSSINMQLDELVRNAGDIFANGENPLARIQRSVQEELASLRDLTQQLRALELDSSQFLGFLKGLTTKFQYEHGIEAQFISEIEEVRLPPRVCAELARIAQEALVNVRKHSKAKEVVVRFSRRDASAVLDIIDNGLGFDFSGYRSHEELLASGKGPAVIMERARGIHGKVSVESIAGQGARVEVCLPYEAEC
jgi:signal transduction histidine kinase